MPRCVAPSPFIGVWMLGIRYQCAGDDCPVDLDIVKGGYLPSGHGKAARDSSFTRRLGWTAVRIWTSLGTNVYVIQQCESNT